MLIKKLQSEPVKGVEGAETRRIVRCPRLMGLALAVVIAPYYRISFADLPVPSANFIHAGEGVAVMQSDGVNMVIDQQSNRAILNWDSFNIGGSNSVTFNQPDSGSIALNRISDTANPSSILGTLTANGQVYLYNPNGFIFGQNSRVNVGSLVATTLNIDTTQFLNGALTNAIDNQQAAFSDTTGNNTGSIEFRSGSEINATDPNGGRILVIAPTIFNGGKLSSPDGQTILAASYDKVYLAASDRDSNLRGLLVEVKTGGTATNSDRAGNMGTIEADRGNITMIGMAVNQTGYVRATTSVDKNGSIRLLARDNATPIQATSISDSATLKAIGVTDGKVTSRPTATYLAVAQDSGSVTLGPDSVTEVTPDATDSSTAPDAQTQLKSRVDIVGKQIWLQSNSTIKATAGDVKITATNSPASPLSTVTSNDSYVYQDAGSVIDVSGTTDTLLSMSRNSLAVDVRSNELAGSPLQRKGVLDGQTVYVDLRKGTSIIDYSGALANVDKTLSERLSTGGNISINSEGDFVQLNGAALNISGGAVNYQSGYIKETQLISDGRVYDLSAADKNRSYDTILGVDVVNHDRWGVTETFDNFSGISNGTYVNGFVEGKAAGSISINAASTLLSANGVKADTIIGPYQTAPANIPAGGTLNVNLHNTDRVQDVSFLAESVVDPITDKIAHVPDPDTLQRDHVDTALVLPDTYLKNSGLAQLHIITNGQVVVDHEAVLAANPGTTIGLSGASVEVDGSIISHAGDVSLSAIPEATDINNSPANLIVGENARIDTSGQWINDVRLAGDPSVDTPIYKDGGAITLSAAGNLALGTGSLLDASGGAWLDANFNINAGKGGDISLVAKSGSSTVTTVLTMDGDLQSYAMYQGGALNIETADILVSDNIPATIVPNQLVIGSRFFSTGGFSKYSLTANTGNLTIDSKIQPQVQNLVLQDNNFQATSATAGLSDGIVLAPTGTSFQSFSSVATLPDSLRQPVSVDFNLKQTLTDQNKNLTVTDRASINTDPGASVSLSSDTSIYMEGAINAPGGDVSLKIVVPTPDPPPFGFLSNQGIWLAPGSTINANSDFIQKPNDQNLNIGQVFNAGNVTLEADRGYVVIQQGASVDVSANTVNMDILGTIPGQGTQYQLQQVAPDAGKISLSSGEGIVIDGQLHANAAPVPGARGGELDIALDQGIRQLKDTSNDGLINLFSFDTRTLVFDSGIGPILSADVKPGDAIDSGLNGLAKIDVSTITNGGFDTLDASVTNISVGTKYSASSDIRFDSDVHLSLKNALVLNAPTIDVNNQDVSLQAAYISIGTASSVRNVLSTSPQSGTGSLALNASQIDVLGDIDVTNAATLGLNADQDVRLIGATSLQVLDQQMGSLNTAADISISARQIYPTTASQFSINLENNSTGTLSISAHGDPVPVLSAAGSLSINAPVIQQGGVIKAPLGTISFNASDQISLLPNSLTSVSADGQIIPYGTTINAGTNWNYDITGRNTLAAQLPEKKVTLSSPSIDMQSGSVVDLSGGGNAVAWEFVSGPGGKTDVLAQGNTGGAFAILPDSGNQYAPYDPLLNNNNFSTGNTVYLTGGNGLAAGYYSILPARYALLPGAMLVTPVAAVKNIYPGKTITRADGTPIVAGKYGVANTDILDSTWNAFVVEDGSIARTRSEYIDTYATNYFTATTPADAGVMVVDANTQLSLAGSITGAHVDNANGSRLDILANNIQVVADGGAVDTGFVKLNASDLSALNVDSLMLGGSRRIEDNGTVVSVRSDQIIIDKNAQLISPEIFLVAKNNITLGSGATLNGSGGSSNGITKNLSLDNNASIVGVSVNPLADITRSGNGAGADITLAQGSTLTADGAILIDGSADVQLNGSIQPNGGDLKLAADQINLGNVPDGTTGLNLTNALLSGLDVNQLVISSQKTIGLYGDFALSFNNLKLNAPGISGISSTGANVSLTASGNIVLTQNGNAGVPEGSGSGSLSVQANEIAFSGNTQDFVIDGFDTVNFTAGQDINATGNGQGMFDFSNADVNVDTPVVQGVAGSILNLQTVGRIDFVNSAGTVADASAINTLGGQMTVDASAVTVDTSIVFPSGLISLKSTGATADTALGANAVVDVSGRTINYVDGSQAGSSGGQILLSSQNGSVNAAAGSQILLAASSVAGDAGQLNISASNGSVSLDSSLTTGNANGFKGAGFSLDVEQADNLAILMQSVQIAGFTNSQDYRVRTGDITLGALAGGAANVKASNITITADSGQITIAGRLDASGDKAGSVRVFADGDVSLNGANIDASASTAAKGGILELGTTSGAINLDSNTHINLSGANGSSTGTLILRAPRTNTNSDVAINDIAANINGADRINIEGVAVYNDSIIGATQQTTYKNDATSWLGNTTDIATRLGVSGDSRVHFLPGVEVDSSGNITLSSTLDFYKWQTNSSNIIGEGALTLRAAGNLNLNASISDSINNEPLYSQIVLDGVTYDFPGPVVPVIKAGDSWNYRLVSGADINSANPLTYTTDSSSSTGNMTLASGVSIRTGNGNIDIASGGNLVLADQTSVIYTTGQPNGSGKYSYSLLDLGAIPDGPQFPDGAGNINIKVADNIDAAVSNQFFTDWLQRVGGKLTNLDSSNPITGMWGVVLKDFQQGIASFGGGDIAVNAGGDINNLSVSTPTTGQIDNNNDVVVRGGGNIDVYAGGNISSARIFADGGTASLRAGGDVAADGSGLNTLLAMGDARVRIESGGTIDIEGIANITTLPMSSLQSNPTYGFNVTDTYYGALNYFFTYGNNSGVDLVSQYGDVVLTNNSKTIEDAATNTALSSINEKSFVSWTLYPGDLTVSALSGDIQLLNTFNMYPSANGNFVLQAGGDITSADTGSNTIIYAQMSDAAQSSLPGVSIPDNTLANITKQMIGDSTALPYRHDSTAPVHNSDMAPATIVANGDIIAYNPLKIVVPKAADVQAGGDIVNLGINIQNLRSTDHSQIIAGGDINYSISPTMSNSAIYVTGPGSIDVIAGGSIDLGNSYGIRSLGDIENFLLPKQGADVSVYAGVNQLDTSSFIATYFNGDASGEAGLINIDVAGYQQQLVDYVTADNYNGDLVTALSAITSDTYANRDQAIAAFNQLDSQQQLQVALASFSASPVSDQSALLLNVLFNEIDLAASDQAGTGNDSAYARGFLAINRLFGTGTSTVTSTVAAAIAANDAPQPVDGNINLAFSRITSSAGGNINLLVPNGDLTVGYTASVKNATPSAGALGVIVSSKGNLSVLTQGDINVNLSRMLTLDGGDISLWSSNGNIDAGRGAKSQLNIPPPLTIVDKQTGQISVIFPPAVSGSGIGAAAFSPGQAPGKVTLAAPGGVINASDAGIRSQGDIVLAANKVLGGENITAGGVAVGIPVATNVTAGLSGLSSATDGAINTASADVSGAVNSSANSGNDGIALVTVEYLGAGDQ